jgi:hypothetical protein
MNHRTLLVLLLLAPGCSGGPPASKPPPGPAASAVASAPSSVPAPSPASSGAASAPSAAAAPAPAGALTPFEEGERWGYKDATGKVVLPPRYRMAYEFNASGTAQALDDQGWACIDAQGKVLLRPYLFDNGPDYPAEGFFRFVEGGKVGFTDESCQPLIPAQFDFAAPFQENLAAVCQGCKAVKDGEHSRMEGGRWGYIDKKGALVVPLELQAAEPFEAGKASVQKDGKRYTIDAKGRPVP